MAWFTNRLGATYGLSRLLEGVLFVSCAMGAACTVVPTVKTVQVEATDRDASNDESQSDAQTRAERQGSAGSRPSAVAPQLAAAGSGSASAPTDAGAMPEPRGAAPTPAAAACAQRQADERFCVENRVSACGADRVAVTTVETCSGNKPFCEEGKCVCGTQCDDSALAEGIECPLGLQIHTSGIYVQSCREPMPLKFTFEGQRVTTFQAASITPRGFAVDPDNMFVFGEALVTYSHAGGAGRVMLDRMSITAVAPDGGDTYFAAAGEIRHTTRWSGTWNTLAPAGGAGQVDHMAVDREAVYWTLTDAKTVWKLPRGATAPVMVATTTGPSGPTVIVANGEWIVWQANNATWKAPSTGGSATMVAAGDSAALAIDLTHVYWADVNAIKRAPLEGGEPQVVAPAEKVMGLGVTERVVYWVENTARGSVRRASKPD
ncbi:MAG TPA: hypothetical protein VJV78_24070 [Polyangiales bacterium]|nr:hypothetical protein [Polyangiales bacterium]